MVWTQTIEFNQIIDRWSPRMRQERITQATIFEVFAEHEIGRELKGISQWLDEHRIAADFGGRRSAPAGAPTDRTPRLASGSGVALRAAQAIPATELRGAGLSSGRFSVVSDLCPTSVVGLAEQVGIAQNHQRDQRHELGGHQSGRGG